MWIVVKVAKDIEGKFTLSLSDIHNAFLCKDDTCGIRTHAGRPHRLSRPTP